MHALHELSVGEAPLLRNTSPDIYEGHSCSLLWYGLRRHTSILAIQRGAFKNGCVSTRATPQQAAAMALINIRREDTAATKPVYFCSPACVCAAQCVLLSSPECVCVHGPECVFVWVAQCICTQHSVCSPHLEGASNTKSGICRCCSSHVCVYICSFISRG